MRKGKNTGRTMDPDMPVLRPSIPPTPTGPSWRGRRSRGGGWGGLMPTMDEFFGTSTQVCGGFWPFSTDMALPVGSIRLLDKRDVARKSMFTTHSLPLSILIEEIEQSCEDIVFIGIQPGDTEFYNPMSPEVFDAVDAVYDAVAANDFSHFVRLGQEQ